MTLVKTPRSAAAASPRPPLAPVNHLPDEVAKRLSLSHCEEEPLSSQPLARVRHPPLTLASVYRLFRWQPVGCLQTDRLAAGVVPTTVHTRSGSNG